MDDAVMKSPSPSSANPEVSKPSRRKAGEAVKYPDRIRIDEDSITRLGEWSDVVSLRLRGVKLTRSDLVNFLIESHPATLTDTELKGLGLRYFDEVKFAQWAIRELKDATVRGEETSLLEIMEANRPARATPVRVRTQKQKSPNTPDNPAKKALNDSALTP